MFRKHEILEHWKLQTSTTLLVLKIIKLKNKNEIKTKLYYSFIGNIFL